MQGRLSMSDDPSLRPAPHHRNSRCDCGSGLRFKHCHGDLISPVYDIRRHLDENLQSKLRIDPNLDLRKPLYRAFDDRDHALSFSRGEVWISTLESCRQTEDQQRVDAEEAIHQYNSGTIIGSSGDREFDLIMQRTGLADANPGIRAVNWTIHDCLNAHGLADAHLLCTSTNVEVGELGKFGRYRVEIWNPGEFFTRLTRTIACEISLQVFVLGLVSYRSRTYRAQENEPGAFGFVKPATYSDEQEARFIWIADGDPNLRPRLFKSPDLRYFCRFLG